MALLTIPQITKGTPATISLDKTTLFALAGVDANAYFDVESNVSKCVVFYKSTVGNQRKQIVFDLSLASPTASILFSVRARNAFAISKIILIDYDSGELTLTGAQIPSGLNINLS